MPMFSFQQDLTQYLLSRGLIDEILPTTPDIADKWQQIAEAYLPDGIREFALYPTAALGWMMYIGMAIAKYWDEDWELYNKVDNLYLYLRDRIDYDHMDEYILQKVLLLSEDDQKFWLEVVGECASRTNNKLMHLGLQPGSKEAFLAFVDALQQLYVMGAAVELNALGYRMIKG